MNAEDNNPRSILLHKTQHLLILLYVLLTIGCPQSPLVGPTHPKPLRDDFYRSTEVLLCKGTNLAQQQIVQAFMEQWMESSNKEIMAGD